MYDFPAPPPRPSRRHLALVRALGDERFRCDRLSATLRRYQCGLRWADFNRPAGSRGVDARRNSYQASRIGSSCTGCAVGAAHARGVVPQESPR